MGENTKIDWADNSLKWCTTCKKKHPKSAFGKDRTRTDGLTTYCLQSRRTGRPRGWHGKPNINPLTGKPGPAPKKPICGDKRQARKRVNQEIMSGDRPHPNKLPCVDCGHTWVEGERRHEYDHYLGYDAEHHRDVESVCTTCHAQREFARMGGFERKRDRLGRFIKNC